MLKTLLLTAVMAFGAANMLKKFVFAAVVGLVASSTLRKLAVAAVVAVGATYADAGFSTRQWYEGMFTCKLTGSSTLLEAYVTTQQGELGGWGRLSNGSGRRKVDTVQPRGDTVSFYIDANPRAYVELQRHKNSATLTGKLVLRGKRHDISCTRR